jgi:transposase
VGRDWRDERIEQLEAEVARLAPFEARVAELMAIEAQQAERIAALEERLRKSSRNSSKPPSSDGPGAATRPKKEATGRKPGGQPGHDQHTRELVAPEKVRKIVECIPKSWDHCGAGLEGVDADPHRHQVTHLPKVEPITDEYRQHSLACKECGKKTLGKLPSGVPSGMFGPSVIAVVALVMGRYRLSKRLTVGLLFDLLGLRMSTGAAVGCQHQASAALAEPYEEAKAQVADEPIKHADETGWREGAERRRVWLWVAVTSAVAVFMVHARRNGDAAKALLNKAHGTVLTVHATLSLQKRSVLDYLRQACEAHLRGTKPPSLLPVAARSPIAIAA